MPHSWRRHCYAYVQCDIENTLTYLLTYLLTILHTRRLFGVIRYVQFDSQVLCACVVESVVLVSTLSAHLFAFNASDWYDSVNLDMYQVNQKKSPLRLLSILQQCMGIFVRNFTRLLSDQMYTLSPSFIEIFLELTKLHSFNHDNPHFTR